MVALFVLLFICLFVCLFATFDLFCFVGLHASLYVQAPRLRAVGSKDFVCLCVLLSFVG